MEQPHEVSCINISILPMKKISSHNLLVVKLELELKQLTPKTLC
jgi:hypothetical protein